MKEQPRGIHNLNPGNIRHSKDDWLGMSPVQNDHNFVTFTSMAMGVRAAAILMRRYEEKGFQTIRQIITRWAPGNENNTPAYVRAVSQGMGVKPDTILDVMQPAVMFNLLKAIFHHENGGDYVADTDIKAGVALALNLH